VAAVAGIALDKFRSSAEANGAIAFALRSAPRKTHLRSLADWEIELRAGTKYVVARTVKSLSLNALIDEAIKMVHHSLDLTSIEDFDHLVTIAPADDYISFQRAAGATLVRYYSVINFPVSMDVRFSIRLADGTTGSPVDQEFAWIPAFRFYRLSQTSPDLFEAFRNLYLSLEALLDHFWPKIDGEKEKRWLERALSAAGQKVSFPLLSTPDVSDPVKEVAGRIYDVRVHLFHAKTGRTLIPDEAVSYSKVAAAYRTLFRLWNEIVRCWIAPRRTGGTLTNIAFKMAVERSMTGAYVAITEDDTIAGSADPASPKGMPVSRFPGTITVHESRPGYMTLTTEAEVASLPIRDLGRILICDANDGVSIVNSVEGCINLSGVDKFEFLNVERLMNKMQPRVGS
jgi:hypothetical protein